MTGAEKLFISLLVIVGALIYNLFFSKAATIKRKIRNSSGKKISAFEDGETAKVIGEIKYIGKTLNAPLSGRRCVYYHVLVEQEKSIGARTPYWSTIVEEEEAGDVIIKDGPHYAFIQTNL